MSAAAAYASYTQASASTASPHEVVRMAYERIITSCDRADHASRAKPERWMQTFHDETVRGQAILVELTAGLAIDHEDPAVNDLSRHLDDLYHYAIGQLVQANMEKSPLPLHAVRLVVDGLRDAWISGPQ